MRHLTGPYPKHNPPMTSFFPLFPFPPVDFRMFLLFAPSPSFSSRPCLSFAVSNTPFLPAAFV